MCARVNGSTLRLTNIQSIFYNFFITDRLNVGLAYWPASLHILIHTLIQELKPEHCMAYAFP